MTASTCRVCGVPTEEDATDCPEHGRAGRSGDPGSTAAPPRGDPRPHDGWSGPSATDGWSGASASDGWSGPSATDDGSGASATDGWSGASATDDGSGPSATDEAPAEAPPRPAPPPPPPSPTGRKGRLSGARGIGLVLVVIVVGLGVWGATMSETESDKAQERVEDYLEGTGQKEFFASDSQFRASFPAYPVRTTETIDAQGTEVPITLYTSEGTDDAFSVGTFDLAATDQFDLVGSVNGQAAGVGGRVEASSLATFAGREAVESVISTPQGVYVKSLVVRSPTRVYLLQVIGRDNPPKGYDRFKGTFEITA